MPTPRNTWEDLFRAPGSQEQGIRVQMRLLRKGGRPLLLLPAQPRLAAATLDLYPAQTGRARAARRLLRCLLRASLPLGTERVCQVISPDDPFARFLASLAGEPAGRVPALGILAGNPASEGQRFLLLVFDAHQQPVAVAKAGLSERARALIEREEGFLASVPHNAVGIPRLRDKFASPALRALALDFFPGDSPRPRQEAALPDLLASWIDSQRTIRASDTPDWARLETAASADEVWTLVAGRIRGRVVHPAICHGDLAPWNVKVSPTGVWMVLDWERGEPAGLPGWDWFHYVIQSGILVGHLPTSALVERVEGLLNSAAFQHYAARGGILGCERELVLAYLLHVVAVIQPAEGREQTGELLKALAGGWRL